MEVNISGTNATKCNKFMDGQGPFLLLVAMIENIVVLMLLFTIKTPKSSHTHRIVMVMAGNDVFGCFVLLLSSFWDAIVCTGFGHSLPCNILGLIGFSSFSWSVHIVMVISVDRFVMVKKPLFHKTRCGWNHLVMACGSGLIAIITVQSMPLFGIGKGYFYYDVNGFCGFNLSTAGGITHKVLVGLFGGVLLTYVFIIILSNIGMRMMLQKRTRRLSNRENDKLRISSSKLEHTRAFEKLALAIAILNIILNLPFAVRYYNHISVLLHVDKI